MNRRTDERKNGGTEEVRPERLHVRDTQFVVNYLALHRALRTPRLRVEGPRTFIKTSPKIVGAGW